MSDIFFSPASFTSLGSTQHTRIISLPARSATLRRKLTSSILRIWDWFVSCVTQTPLFHRGPVPLSKLCFRGDDLPAVSPLSFLCKSTKHCHFNATVCHSPAHNPNHKATSSSKFWGLQQSTASLPLLPEQGLFRSLSGLLNAPAQVNQHASVSAESLRFLKHPRGPGLSKVTLQDCGRLQSDPELVSTRQDPLNLLEAVILVQALCFYL